MPRIADVMTRDVETIQPQASLQAAAQLMDELNVGALPVCDGQRLVGMLTDRDITVRATATGLAPREARVADVMTEHTRWCTEDQSTEDVLQQMSDVQIRRIPVLNARQELVGIVSLGDLATRQQDDVQATLRDISYPSEPDRSLV
ncbi:MAG: CBS domain-containing protein [Rubrivivax sp.]|nr:MAG: CBS domain-containing protein [Rubrivivax sp.]